ncbi:MAG TPA: ABC transporter permease [Firmicutes bacterium]|jgi:osmoprotectant transport system permease protein|nr:ABC transporter permease [Bacillota bacterium]
MSVVNYFSKNTSMIWSALEQHFALFAISIIVAIVIGIALSILITDEGREKLARVVIAISGAALSVPSIAIIALTFIFVGIGATPAIIALVIYSIVPILFNATSGLSSVDQKIIEAGKGMGFTKSQILWKIKFPLALPVIIAGIRNTATINIGTATIAAVIGGGGLGDLIYIGLKLNRGEIIFIGSFLTALLAICVDALFALLEKTITPKGLNAMRS